ncbi:MAG: HAMP domain-containing sensor histidine kinase [Alphaproteobacteria bacterium]|nr:HAMP domain-containing sensor histidine kinase [Alphaproteobacteria bacterium]
MRVPLPLLFLLLMVLVIFAVYDILRQSYAVHGEANRRVARAVLESTLTRVNTGLNDIAYRLAMEDRPFDAGLPEVVLRDDITDAKDLASRTLILGFDSGHRILKGRIGHDVLGPARLTRVASQPALPRLFKSQTVTNRLPDALLVMVNDVPFILSDPQPLRAAGQADRSAFLVIGLPARSMVFDELQKYEVFGSGNLKSYLEEQDDLSGLAELIVNLQEQNYAKFHFSAVAQIIILLVAFVIAVMIGRHVDEKNDALRQSRDTIAEREREAQHLRQLAEQASEAKSQFIHNMSHELRTPLNAILGYAEVITNETFGALEGPLERYKESAGTIQNGGLRLLNSLSQVLEYSSLIDGDDEIREEKVDLALLLLELVSEFQDRMEARKITLDVARLPELPSLRADRDMMRSLFSQLIANAIEYSGDGGSVTVSSASLPDGRLQVAVSDHGKGMDPDLQSHAFEAFVQGEDVYARQHQGMGLGLSLARAYARCHGAEISIDSTLGKGTVVTVVFPAERSLLESDRTSQAPGPAQSEVAPPDGVAAWA